MVKKLASPLTTKGSLPFKAHLRHVYQPVDTFWRTVGGMMASEKKSVWSFFSHHHHHASPFQGASIYLPERHFQVKSVTYFW